MQQNCSKTSKIFHFPKLSSFLKDFLTFEYGWKTHFRRVQKHCQMVKSAIRQPQIDSVSFANKNQFEDCFWLMVEIAFLRKKNFALSSFPLLSYLLIFMLALEEVDRVWKDETFLVVLKHCAMAGNISGVLRRATSPLSLCEPVLRCAQDSQEMECGLANHWTKVSLHALDHSLHGNTLFFI